MIARTKEEIEVLREGGRRLAKYLEILRKMVKPGVTAKELDDRGLELILEGGDKPAFTGYASGKNGEKFPGCLCVSVNDTIVHSPGATNNVVFKDGDVVSLDFGIVHGGLYTD